MSHIGERRHSTKQSDESALEAELALFGCTELRSTPKATPDSAHYAMTL